MCIGQISCDADVLRVVWVPVCAVRFAGVCLMLAWTACVPKATRVGSYAALPGLVNRHMGARSLLGHAQNRQLAARCRV